MFADLPRVSWVAGLDSWVGCICVTLLGCLLIMLVLIILLRYCGLLDWLL